MAPEPGPRPFAALGCFSAAVFGAIGFVVFGRVAGSWLFYPVLIVILLALVLVLLRILARRR